MPFYNRGKSKGSADWIAGTWRVLLVTSAYVPSPAHTFVADVVASEVSGGGYARVAVANRAFTIDNVKNEADFTADTTTFASLTASFRYAILYRFGTNDADSELHSYYDLNAQAIVAAPFDVRWNGGATNGLVFKAT